MSDPPDQTALSHSSVKLLAGVAATTPEDESEAAAIAARLGVPLRHPPGPSEAYTLWVDRGRVRLQPPLSVARHPIGVDFSGAGHTYRRHHGGGRRQPIARAVGLAAHRELDLIDATAGLGRDAFVLASLGARVRLIERSALLAVMLENAIALGRADPEIADIVGRMELIEADAVMYLGGLDAARRPEVVYLDPMYPRRDKSAKVKKEMVVLQTLIGESRDAAALLDAALAAARERVVVKRPARAPALADRQPDAQTGAGNTRFDIYLRRGNRTAIDLTPGDTGFTGKAVKDK